MEITVGLGVLTTTGAAVEQTLSLTTAGWLGTTAAGYDASGRVRNSRSAGDAPFVLSNNTSLVVKGARILLLRTILIITESCTPFLIRRATSFASSAHAMPVQAMKSTIGRIARFILSIFILLEK